MTSSVPRKIRNPKPEIRNKSECQNSKLKRRSFGHWYLGNLDLFRISDFGFSLSYSSIALLIRGNDIECPTQNPKSETRNPKQIRMSKLKTQTKKFRSLVF